MRYIYLAVVMAFGFIGPTLAAPPDAQCDCTIFPFKPNPPCHKECSVAILQRASSSSLQKLLGIKDDTAQKIVAARNNGARSLTDFQNKLSPEDTRQVTDGLKKLSTDKIKSSTELAGLKTEKSTSRTD